MIDLSHAFEAGMVTFPGFPAPRMEHYIGFDQSHAQIAPGREFAIDYVQFVAGSGTYIDAPRHMDRHGGDVASLPLDRLVDVPVCIVAAPLGRRDYRPSDFAGVDLSGRAVLLHTGWDKLWGTTAYATGSPYLGPEAARYLVAQRVALVGIDAVLIDDIDDPDERPLREAHVSLLAAGIPIVENLRGLDGVPRAGATLFAAPVAVRGVGSFPVRVLARPHDVRLGGNVQGAP